MQTLDQEGNVESGVTIAPVVHELIGPMVINFNQADDRRGDGGGGGRPAASRQHADGRLRRRPDRRVRQRPGGHGAAGQAQRDTPGVFTANTPRTLRDAAAARNELRRNIRGIVKMTDVEIPLRDGSYVCADVFRPADDGHYPVVMNQGFYGKSFDHGVIGSDAGSRGRRRCWRTATSPATPTACSTRTTRASTRRSGCPKGYVCIRVDARGVGNSPGLQAPFSVQQAEDYYDAIEWAGTQPWSNGNVGLWGMSYLAITQHTVASLQPPHLKAMIALGTDADLYNEAFYGGGLFGEGFWMWWRKAMAGHNFVGERQETDWLAQVLATPFNDPAAYGTRGSIFMRPELEKATAPVWIVGPQTGVVIHQAGSSETFIRSTGAHGEEVRLRRRMVPAQLQGVDDRRAHAVLRPLAQGRRQRRHGRRAGAGPGADRQRRPLRLGGVRVADRPDRPTAAGTWTPPPSDWAGDGRRTRLPAHQLDARRPPRPARPTTPTSTSDSPSRRRSVRRRHAALVDRCRRSSASR